MGAFLLHKKTTDIFSKREFDYFKERGFGEPHRFSLGDWNLNLFSKTILKNKNYLFIDDSALFVTGTLIYHGEDYETSIKLLLIDKIKNNICADKIYGSFTIIFYIKGQISILRDGSNVSNVYYNSVNTVISSSFLAACNAHDGTLSINKESITENLISGYLIGPVTIFNEIHRIEKDDIQSIGNIDVLSINNEEGEYKPIDFEDALQEQLNCLGVYFKSTKRLADKFGVDSGLTGGFDSRLLLILALKYFRKVSFHSYWRNQRSREFECAKAICIKAGQVLKAVQVTYPLEMDRNQLAATMSAAFYYYDGHVRKHSYWHEEYNTLLYRKKILDGAGLGLHGIGGEQYRNEERVFFNHRIFFNWIKYDLIYTSSGDCFNEKKFENDFIDSYQKKIQRILKINSRTIDWYEIKRFYNEIQIPGLRAVRTNIENSDIFFLSPFADYNVSKRAYNAIPFLGLSGYFQQQMIKRLDPEIAALLSDYGYDFFKGEPFYSKFNTLLKEFMPSPLFHQLYINRKGSHNDNNYRKFTDRFPELEELEQKVLDIQLPINLDILKTKSDLYPLIWEVGYLLLKFRSKLI
jgi:hypothetical protein